jgi:hypothetical protein
VLQQVERTLEWGLMNSNHLVSNIECSYTRNELADMLKRPSGKRVLQEGCQSVTGVLQGCYKRPFKRHVRNTLVTYL